MEIKEELKESCNDMGSQQMTLPGPVQDAGAQSSVVVHSLLGKDDSGLCGPGVLDDGGQEPEAAPRNPWQVLRDQEQQSRRKSRGEAASEPNMKAVGRQKRA